MPLHEQLLQMVVFRWLSRVIFTLDFTPEAGEEVESIGIISDGELIGVTGGSSKEADFVFRVEGDAMTEARERCIAEDFKFLEGHAI
jgi:hypothetical protein